MTKIVTRFAPSPTGYLHIGGARCALFNYLIAENARSKGIDAKLLLRIEDTDSKRNKQGALEQIKNSLKWLGIEIDGDIIFQSKRANLYKKAATELLNSGKAYYCFLNPDELEILKAESREKQIPLRSKWRDKTGPEIEAELKKNIPPVIRLKIPENGAITLEDGLQGAITVDNAQIDDMVLLRSDGSATYMLASVYDDHHTGVTDIIRGDDHLTNAIRQIAIYKAFGWQVPRMTHIPLIHDANGSKLSKRTGALGIEQYAEKGFLPDALFNYMLRLGWSHGDDEIINRKQAAQWFNIKSLSKAAARLDDAKMLNLNSHYINMMDSAQMIEVIEESLKKENINISAEEKRKIDLAAASIKERSSLLPDLADLAKIYLNNLPAITKEAQEIIRNANKNLIMAMIDFLSSKKEPVTTEQVKHLIKEFAKINNSSLKIIMPPVRALIAGRALSPAAFEIISIIGIKQALCRLKRIEKLYD